ncbi:hypothetical protein ASG04_11860 [Curtobacterium sp. Leaf183]|uniref:hypothetical protein n=1 Tax=Curtobacterium sp. Leaf183 TaxID=1736291 RepID=UPI0007009F7E|nr:hypothetical protein [Curtobacterium sp. Leaf183]KQS07868.1 hypothetical protein ASG04_11860 [Curtobacterium sp. Leaf183]
MIIANILIPVALSVATLGLSDPAIDTAGAPEPVLVPTARVQIADGAPAITNESVWFSAGIPTAAGNCDDTNVE